MATEIEERRVEAVDLRIGMFVCRLDRPWEGTPFPLQGLELRTEDDVRRVRELCEFVYVDAHREINDSMRRQILARTSLQEARFRRSTTYADRVSVEDELPRAREALQTASDMVDRLYYEVASGRELSIEYVEQAVRPLVASVLRSADAFLYLEGMRRHDSYTYSHAISCSALAAAFGRHMGLHEDTIISLAAGGLLMDVGKTRVPEALLNYPGSLAAGDVETVRAHVGHGLDILASAGINDPDVVAIVRTHHERHDGSGYPHHLVGNAIPVAGRMLGMIDTYDAMASVRPYRPPISRHQALQHIYGARDKLFQAELVEQFQVCLGVYPTGSLVELTSGEVAVVMMQNQARRLRPRVLVLSTPTKQPLTDFRVFDLLNQANNDAGAVEITRSLAIGEYGINAAEHFLQ